MALLFFGGRFLKRKRKDLFFLPFPPSLAAAGGGGEEGENGIMRHIKMGKESF